MVIDTVYRHSAVLAGRDVQEIVLTRAREVREFLHVAVSTGRGQRGMR